MKELALVNGNIYTQDPSFPRASAILFRDGCVAVIGSDDRIRTASRQAEVIDLEGQLALPGLTDAHFHFYDWSFSRRNLLLADTRSKDDLLKRLAKKADSLPEDEWILGQGWNETRWDDQELPNRADLDKSSPNNPCILWRSDLHLAAVNSKALEKAGITASTPDPSDGVIDRDSSGQATGILRELAINLVSNRIPTPSEDETLQAMREALPALHKLGLTGLHDFRIMGGPEGARAFQAYQRLRANDELPLRLWMHIPYERLDQAIALGLRTGFGDHYLRVGHVKLFSDGSQGARTAWMLETYEDVAHAGMPLTPMGEIADAVYRADRAGLAVAIHAIGDRANRELIGVFEEVLQHRTTSSYARPSAPHRIEHVQNIRPDDLPRLARLEVIASVQPIHATDDMLMIEQSVGERSRYCYVFKDMIEAGITLALGSDCPVADPNPFLGIHAAVTRQNRNNHPIKGWHPAQRISVAEAVWGYTMGPAITTGRAKEQGSLTPGKLGDLIVVDRDIFKIEPPEISGTQVKMTVLGGQVVHRI
jgi:predicted amidohydrolase YtcJ